LGYLMSEKFSDIAHALGFAELKKEAVLINDEKLKVKCRSYAQGFFDEIKLENKFQQCINQHQANGYRILESESR
jgi:tetrahydrodipicolinate N-succinyltransferase